jgi:energy-converting hydrogenase B subunit L
MVMADASLKTLAKIFISGFYENLERIVFGTDRYTSKEMKNTILSGVKLPRSVFEELCIGCKGCANVCPTGCIEMIPIEPVKLTDFYSKECVPKINSYNCIFCLYCHDFCPVFSIFSEVSPIHPRHVGEECMEIDVSKLLERPVEIPEEQLQKIARILSINLSRLINEENKKEKYDNQNKN